MPTLDSRQNPSGIKETLNRGGLLKNLSASSKSVMVATNLAPNFDLEDIYNFN